MNKSRKMEAGKYRSLFSTEMGCGGVVANTDGLVEVFLPFAGNSREEMLARIGELYPLAMGETPLTKEAAVRLARYFAGERMEFDLPIDRRGFTPFQCSVYDAVIRIPYGEVRTYGEIAAKIGRPRSARGIGRAMAENPLPIIIPCHRVVGASGAMTGYSGPGGVGSKQWLLRMEGVAIDRRGNAGKTD